jgi:hypothetical protein
MIDLVKYVDNMSSLQKLEVYMDYYVSMLSLKLNFHLVDKTKDNWNHGYGVPCKEYLGLAFYYLWKDLNIKSFDEFISGKNIVVHDMGECWKENGFAQRFRTEYYGIHDWYWKKKSRIESSLKSLMTND